MFFLLFFPLFIRSQEEDPQEYINHIRALISKIPNFGVLIEEIGATPEEINEYNAEINEYKSCNFLDEEEGFEAEEKDVLKSLCHSLFEPFQGVFVSNGKNVNDVLAGVPAKNQVLIIPSEVEQEIDFKKLTSTTSVLCLNLSDFMSGFSTKAKIRNSVKNFIKTIAKHKSSLDGTPRSFINILKNVKKDHKNPKGYSSIKIVGSMNQKVTYLAVHGFTVTFTQTECDVQNLQLTGNARLSEASKSIKSDFLYLTLDTIELLETLGGKAKQTTFIDDITGTYNTITLEYNQKYLLFKKTPGREEVEMQIPYGVTKDSLGLIGDYDFTTQPITVKIDLAAGTQLDNYVNLNLSFGHNYNSGLFGIEDFIKDYMPKSLADSVPQVTFEYSEAWKQVNEDQRPKLTVVSDNEVVKVDLTNVKETFEVKQEAPATIQRIVDDDGGLSAGAIAGIVIACVVVVAAIVAVVVYFVVIRKKRNSSHEADA